MNLTVRQTRFVDELAVSGNAAAAARAAGYSARSARQIASENLTKPDILAAIALRKQAEAAQLALRKEHIISAILGAIVMARETQKPSTEISGWKEIAKLLGFYEQAPIANKSLSPRAQRVKDHFESMSTNELLELLAARRETMKA